MIAKIVEVRKESCWNGGVETRLEVDNTWNFPSTEGYFQLMIYSPDKSEFRGVFKARNLLHMKILAVEEETDKISPEDIITAIF